MKPLAADWFFLFRPWSFTATLVPFLVAAGIGAGRQDGHWVSWAVGIVSGVLFQATVNLLNTWGDERSGVDDVPGAIRTTPQVHDGRVSMEALLRTAVACAAIASILGLSLCLYQDKGVWRFNVPLVCAGTLGFLGATNYTTGVKFKYRGLGVPFVSFLMGPLEIFVAYVILFPSADLPTQAFACSRTLLTSLSAILPIAALVGVIMHGNDMRDMPTDRTAGIMTLALMLGERGALGYYCLCHTAPYLLTLLTFLLRANGPAGLSPWPLLPLLAAPLSIRTMTSAVRTYRSCPRRPPWFGLERASGKILLVYGILQALAMALR